MAVGQGFGLYYRNLSGKNASTTIFIVKRLAIDKTAIFTAY
jgi:hypothetical protein